MSELCSYCRLINNGGPEVCENYPKGWCPVGWTPEEGDMETIPASTLSDLTTGDQSAETVAPRKKERVA